MFGKLIAAENELAGEGGSQSGHEQADGNAVQPALNGDSNDLREHMVGILFSRSSKLTHLQKQVSLS